MTEYALTEEEDCEICMMRMKYAVKLYCGHYFHAYCIMQLISSEKNCCPICKSPLNRQYATRVCQNGNVLGNIMQNVINPLLVRGNQEASEHNVERIRRVFPSISRSEIIEEINIAGNVEQAIVNLSERV